MTFDPTKIDAKPITLDQARSEVAREVQVRMNAYPKFIAAGKISDDKATSQMAGMMKAQQILDWFARVEADVRAAMKLLVDAKAHHAKWAGKGAAESPADEAGIAIALLALVRERPAVLGRIIDDPALTAVLEAFPAGQLAAIRQLSERAA